MLGALRICDLYTGKGSFIDFCLLGLAQTWPFLIGWRVLRIFDDVKARVLVEMFGVHGDQVNIVEQHRHTLISLVGALCGGRASRTCSKLILRSHKNLKLFFFAREKLLSH